MAPLRAWVGPGVLFSVTQLQYLSIILGKIYLNHFNLQYYVLSLNRSLGMGINYMSYISSLSWACTALEKNCHLFLYQYLVEDTRCVQPMAEEGWKSQDKVYEGSKVREMETSTERECIAMVYSVYSLQQIGKVFSFIFYHFCCLPSLYFFSTILRRGKKGLFFFFSYIGATIFLIVKILDGLLMSVFHNE